MLQAVLKTRCNFIKDYFHEIHAKKITNHIEEIDL